jgi:hypothetical protein
MILLTTKTAILAAISDISVTGKKLDQMIWVAAVSVTAHAEKHGDVTLANTLVEAMPKGSRVNALLGFLEAFGKFTYDEENKKLGFDKSKTTDIDGAQAQSWTAFKPEPPYQGMNLEMALAALIKKANDRVDSDNEADDIDSGRLSVLAKLLNDWDAETATDALIAESTPIVMAA